MVLPNTGNMYPAHHPVEFPSTASDPNQWGANSTGNPNTGSYAYVATKIRASDVGPTGDGWNPYPGKTSLAQLGVGSSDVVRRFPWVVVGDAWQKRNTSTNTRVQVRNIRHQVLMFNGSWVDAGSSSLSVQPSTYGAWHSIFLGPGMSSGNGQGYAQSIGTGSSLSDGRIESDGGSSLGSIGMGTGSVGVASGGQVPLQYFNTFVWHFYPLAGFDRTRSDLENNYAGSVICMEGRLTLHDPNGVDDRAKSAMLLIMGADYYNVSQNLYYIGEAMHSRWKQVTSQWQTFCETDIAAATLKGNPPPGFTL